MTAPPVRDWKVPSLPLKSRYGVSNASSSPKNRKKENLLEVKVLMKEKKDNRAEVSTNASKIN
jgi:hypothetical protein